MKLARLGYDQGALAEFYQEAIERLGGLCERTWYDHLRVVAEGVAAKPWNSDGALLDTELVFSAPETHAPKDPTVEVFPGCPLTFRLVDLLRPEPIPFERVLLGSSGKLTPPTPDVAEKLWYLQHPGTNRWRIESGFVRTHHFSLLTLVRCEIQAIDQHWSLHRLVRSLPGGERDDSLENEFDFAEVVTDSAESVEWPQPTTNRLKELLSQALSEELESELSAIRGRQENYLRRELERVDDYFANYEREVHERAARSRTETTKLKSVERLAAAQAEHARRRADQVQRHAIRVVPYFDALLLLAEPAWKARVTVSRPNEVRAHDAVFVPRNRKWSVTAD